MVDTADGVARHPKGMGGESKGRLAWMVKPWASGMEATTPPAWKPSSNSGRSGPGGARPMAAPRRVGRPREGGPTLRKPCLLPRRRGGGRDRDAHLNTPTRGQPKGATRQDARQESGDGNARDMAKDMDMATERENDTALGHRRRRRRESLLGPCRVAVVWDRDRGRGRLHTMYAWA